MNTALSQFNNTSVPFDACTTIQELFELKAREHPKRTAVILQGLTLTYEDLNVKSHALACHLRKVGVKREQIVGILCERSFELVIGLFGIIRSGGAYLPLSPNDPKDRIELVMADSAIDVLLVQKKFRDKVDFGGLTIEIDAFVDVTFSPEDLPLINTSRDLLYVIYTSGSTGVPKGVMIEHRSLVNRLLWMQREYPITCHDTILQKTTFNFDVSVWELFWWAITGAKVCLLPPNGEKNPLELVKTIETYKISVLHFVPSMLNVFLGYLEGSALCESLSSVRLVFSSGEILSAKHVEHFHYLFGPMGAKKLINLYGPTEATIDVTHYDCSLGIKKGKVPIGKPISNTSIYIMDGETLVDVGVAGELIIAGVGLARGYLNRAELTAVKFIDNPFSPNERMYKTGDLARWLEDGNIEFISRIDEQIKIRGFRIELGEIEYTMLKMRDVKECIVHTISYSESVVLLILYYVSDFEIPPQLLKDFLSKHLPEYMVPGKFMRIENIPLSPNGKANKKALPDPFSTRVPL